MLIFLRSCSSDFVLRAVLFGAVTRFTRASYGTDWSNIYQTSSLASLRSLWMRSFRGNRFKRPTSIWKMPRTWVRLYALSPEVENDFRLHCVAFKSSP